VIRNARMPDFEARRSVCFGDAFACRKVRLAGVCFISRGRDAHVRAGVAEPGEDAGDGDAAARARARAAAVRGAGQGHLGEHLASRAAGGARAEHHAGGRAQARGRVRGAGSGEHDGDRGEPVAAARDRGVLAVPHPRCGREVRGGRGERGDPCRDREPPDRVLGGGHRAHFEAREAVLGVMISAGRLCKTEAVYGQTVCWAFMQNGSSLWANRLLGVYEQNGNTA